MSLAKKTSIGILWNFFEQFARRGIGVLVTLILAYFLSPEAYGLIAMMAVFLALGSSLMESGFKQALIRMPIVTQVDYNTAFFANIALGLFSYLVLFLAAPLIANFYNESQLIVFIRVAALSIVFNSFQVVQASNLSRELNFKVQVKATLPASVISGVFAIYLAYLGLGVWSLIAQMLSAALLQTIFLWLAQGWRPSKDFSVPKLKEMYNFGYKLFLSGAINTIFNNLYVLIVAKLFSTTIAGLYYFSNQIKQLIISQLVSSIEAVTYPALSRLQSNNENLLMGYRRVISVTTFILFPAMLFLAVLAEPLFAIFLPEKWFIAASYLQIMCLGATLYPLHSINLNILKVKGRSDLFLWLEIIKKAVAILVILVSIRWGIYGLLLGQIITSFIAYIPNSYFSKKLIGYGMLSQIKDFGGYGILSILISLSAMLINRIFNLSDFFMLAVIFPTMIILYIGITYKLKRDDITYLYNTIFSKS